MLTNNKLQSARSSSNLHVSCVAKVDAALSGSLVASVLQADHACKKRNVYNG
jgi:hypothetical protein